MKRILFVCLGNICRSSSAEEVMRTLIKKEGLEHEIEVDSAGILSYHRGELPDSRMRMHASRRGYNLTHRSRPVCTEDFYHFDMILESQGKKDEALKLYQDAKKKYVNAMLVQSGEIDKYIERASNYV